MEVTSDTEVVTERIFDAPRQLVYDTFTDPTLIPEWWGPRGTVTVVDEMDVRVGGKWRFVHDPGTADETGFRGEFRQLNPPESVVQTFEWEGLPVTSSSSRSTSKTWVTDGPSSATCPPLPLPTTSTA